MDQNNTNQQMPSMDTSQKIKHVFGCMGATMHLTPGFKLLQAGDIAHCPECGAEVYDASDTPVGKLYLGFARIDLGKLP